MKIRFRVVTSHDYDAAPSTTQPPRMATLEVGIKYEDRTYHRGESTATFARKTFDVYTGDDEIADWAATTIATCLRGLVPENERC